MAGTDTVRESIYKSWCEKEYPGNAVVFQIHDWVLALLWWSIMDC